MKLYSVERLKSTLSKIDKKGYKAYKELEGAYQITPDLIFILDHAQGDPFAAPSRARVRIKMQKARIPKDLWKNKIRKIALQDFILRIFSKNLKVFSKHRGSGKSGLYHVDSGAQEVIMRSGCIITQDFLELRFFMGLPASGRRILADVALNMITKEIIKASESVFFDNLSLKELEEFINTVEDQEYIRSQLDEKGIVAFIKDGSVLPRRSGVDERPMQKNVVLFKSPETLRVSFETLHHGRISGMGIPKGVTLIVGGGFHGKTTLLEAIARGVYPHIPKDGREWVVTNPTAVMVRSEDGRYVEGVDISPFIHDLPMKKSTSFFCTEDASGSTSLAASIMEALEMGAKVLLMDEDKSATNFLIRDARMQALIPKEKEPITPFIDKVRLLYKDYGVSTVLVLGGSGDYLDVADTVIGLDTYVPFDLTSDAKRVAQSIPTSRSPEGGEKFGEIKKRILLAESFQPKRGKKERVKSKGLREIIFGEEIIDVSDVEQLVDNSQARATAEIIRFYGKHIAKEGIPLKKGLSEIIKMIEEEGFDTLAGYPVVDFAAPRIFEVSAAINRLRSLKVKRP